jgi:hypothetical protein
MFVVLGFMAVGSAWAVGLGAGTTPSSVWVTWTAGSISPSLVGEPVSFTAAVTGTASAGSPSGTVEFFSDGKVICSQPLIRGDGAISTATCSVSSLPVSAGGHAITASYGGDATYDASGMSSAFTQVVDRVPVSLSVGVPTPDAVGVGDSATIAVSVSPIWAWPDIAMPTGWVSVKSNDATDIGSDAALKADGTATLSITPTAVNAGARVITVTYTGDDNFKGAASSAALEVRKGSPVVTVSSSPNPSTFGQAVTFTATVRASASSLKVPPGTVTFTPGALCAGGSLDAAGSATCTVSGLPGGDHTVAAQFDPDDSANYHSAQSQSITQTVGKATVHVDPNDASTIYGDPDPTPTATLRAADFKDGDTATTSGVTGAADCQVGAHAPDAGAYPGVLACAPGSLSAANYTFTPGVPGDLTITPASQTIVFSSTPPAQPQFGGSYTVIAIGGGSGNPVLFSLDASSDPGACRLSGSTVSFSAAGSCVIDANQAGNNNFTPAAEAQQALTVQQPPATATTTSMTSSVNPSLDTQLVTFTATVTGAAPGGTVTFTDGSTTLGARTLDGSGSATYLTSTLAIGTHPITAAYGGDARTAPSNSQALVQTVRADTPGALCRLTDQYVEGSSRYKALPAWQRKLVDTLADQACAALDRITPTLSSRQLAAIVASYKTVVGALSDQGWLTSVQAQTLDGLADHVHA